MTLKGLILSLLLMLSLLATVSASRRHHRYYRNTYGHRVDSLVHARTVRPGAAPECNEVTYRVVAVRQA